MKNRVDERRRRGDSDSGRTRPRRRRVEPRAALWPENGAATERRSRREDKPSSSARRSWTARPAGRRCPAIPTSADPRTRRGASAGLIALSRRRRRRKKDADVHNMRYFIIAGALAGVFPGPIADDISGRKRRAGEQEEAGGLHRGSKRRCCWQKLN